MEKFQKKFSTLSLKLNYWSPRHQTAVFLCFQGFDFFQMLLAFYKYYKYLISLLSLKENKESLQEG